MKVGNLPYIAALVVLAACSQVKLVESERQEVGGSLSVEPRMAWNRVAAPPVTGISWTQYGVKLDRLDFYVALEEGDTLIELPGQDDTLPKFEPGMRPNDVMDFVVDTYAAAGFGDMEARYLRPAKFGKLSGFRFDLSLLSPDGLAYEGLAIAAIEDDRLHLIVYRAARIYYFPRYKDEAEQIFSTIIVGS